MWHNVGRAGVQMATPRERRMNTDEKTRSGTRPRQTPADMRAYDHHVDATTQALLFALLGAVLGSGVVLAWRISEHQLQHVPKQEEPAVPTGVATVLAAVSYTH